MSRIGKLPIEAPDSVDVTVGEGNLVTVKGPKGELQQQLDADIAIAVDGGTITVTRPTNQPRHRAAHGLTRSLLQNMVTGVTEGYEVTLEIVGVGYRFTAKGKDVDLSAGFSHEVLLKAPEGIDFTVDGQTTLKIAGIDKQLVGQVAADIRAKRPPEPYKGKGIRYKDEYVRRKIGKRAQ